MAQQLYPDLKEGERDPVHDSDDLRVMWVSIEHAPCKCGCTVGKEHMWTVGGLIECAECEREVDQSRFFRFNDR